MNFFCDIVDTINEWTGKILSVVIIPMIVLTTIEVILRYAFDSPTIWVWDVNIQLLGLLTVMGAGYTLLHGGHVTVDVLTSLFSERMKAAMGLITAGLFFFSIGILFWRCGLESWSSLLQKEAYTSIWGPPVYPLKIAMSLGFLMLLLQGVADFLRKLKIVLSIGSGVNS